ncbi:MAG: alpha-galactosidase [Clostridia bacterium]|nr:alpha-galactosidase [Clostridia bacterium]
MLLDYTQNGIHAIFEVTDGGLVILKQLSAGELAHTGSKASAHGNIAQIHLTGENANDHHGFKHTGASRSFTLKYISHDYYENELGNKLEFHLADDKLAVTVHYQFYTGAAALRSWQEIKNISDEIIGLEYAASFSYLGLDEGEGRVSDKLHLAIPHNSWVREVVWKEDTLGELGFEKFSGNSTKRISIANTGTWSTKEYLPMGCIRNDASGNAILWQIEANGSWQWEVADAAGLMYLRLSGPNEQENGWYKELIPGETFETVKAAVSVGSDFNEALAAMTAYRRKIFRNNPENAAIPVIFNDYLHCLGADPTEEKELPLIDRAADAGAEYFVMDAGWYADGTWWETVGEWQPIARRFPHGIKYVFDYIRSRGMVPGIWLEIEVMGIGCPLAKEWDDDCFFMRHGKRVIDHGRYHLDFRNEKVRAFTMDVVRRVVEEYGVGYIKMDYNIDGGIGTEVDADSFGDGLLEHNRAFTSWIDEIRDRWPSLILESCASGGLRMDYSTLSQRHIQSLTDNTSARDTAFIACNAPTAVLPEQAAIWSFPLKDDSADMVAFNMANAMLQRIHLSGGILHISDENFALVKEGVAVYKQLRADTAAAVPFYPLGLSDYPDGWRAVAFRCPDCVRLNIWRIDGESDTLEIPLAAKEAKVLYPSNTEGSITVGDTLTVHLPKQNTALVVEVR